MTNDTEENWEGVKKFFEKLNEKVKEIDKKEGELEILKLQKEVEIDREKEETRRRRKRWRKKIRKEKNLEKRNEYTKEYKRMKNREKNLSIKQRKVKQKIEAEIIEELCKEYEGIAWEWLKRLIPKRKKKKQELQEVIDQEGNIKGKDEILQIWRKAYETLGKETERDEKIYDTEFKKKIIKEVKEMEEKEMKKNSEQENTVTKLNKPIEIEEVRAVIKKLKNGKATGNDKITNEVIKYGGDNVKRLIWVMIRKCYELEKSPKQWLEGIMHPIYKKGDKRDPLNYRGIALLNTISKIYEAILNNRLYRWCEDNDIILEEQGGFREERGCADQIFILSSILKSRKKKKTYCCYIDLKKAYDTVWRTGLWHRLWKKGIKGKMWKTLKNFYRKTITRIRINGVMTEEFVTEKGVKQGGVLSPILFSIYRNELIEELKDTEIGIELEEGRVNALFYADDIILISETREELQEMMKI